MKQNPLARRSEGNPCHLAEFKLQRRRTSAGSGILDASAPITSCSSGNSLSRGLSWNGATFACIGGNSFTASSSRETLQPTQDVTLVWAHHSSRSQKRKRVISLSALGYPLAAVGSAFTFLWCNTLCGIREKFNPNLSGFRLTMERDESVARAHFSVCACALLASS